MNAKVNCHHINHNTPDGSTINLHRHSTTELGLSCSTST